MAISLECNFDPQRAISQMEGKMDELLEMLLLTSVGVGEEGGGVIHREVECLLLFRGMAEEAAPSAAGRWLSSAGERKMVGRCWWWGNLAIKVVRRW